MVVPDSTKTFSKAVFGNAYWLSTAVVIAGFADGRFTQRIVASRLNLPDNLVGPSLRRMSVAGLVKDVEGEWERVPSPMWDFVAALEAGL